MGFVSNSSSASFTIDWRCHIKDGNGEPLSMIEAIKAFVDVDDFDIESTQQDKGYWKYVYQEPVRLAREIHERTLQVGPGHFRTNFFTSMLNWDIDLGPVAGAFLLTHVVKRARLDNDPDGDIEFTIEEIRLEEQG
jgi:hypothetical protein